MIDFVERLGELTIQVAIKLMIANSALQIIAALWGYDYNPMRFWWAVLH